MLKIAQNDLLIRKTVPSTSPRIEKLESHRRSCSQVHTGLVHACTCLQMSPAVPGTAGNTHRNPDASSGAAAQTTDQSHACTWRERVLKTPRGPRTLQERVGSMTPLTS